MLPIKILKSYLPYVKGVLSLESPETTNKNNATPNNSKLSKCEAISSVTQPIIPANLVLIVTGMRR